MSPSLSTEGPVRLRNKGRAHRTIQVTSGFVHFWGGLAPGDQFYLDEKWRSINETPTELRLAAAGWLGGFGTPPPPWLAGWLAGAPPENSQNMQCTIVPPLLTHGMGMGMGLQGWGGSATFQEHPYLILQVALPSEPPINTKNTKHRITTSDHPF